MGQRRLLLLEFLNRDRFFQFRSELFPFIRAYALSQGVDVRSLSVGFDARTLPHSRFLMDLDRDDARLLAEKIRAFAPTHVLMNEELDEHLGERLAAALGDAHVSVYMRDPGVEFSAQERLDRWLGLDPAPRGEQAEIVDLVEPDYACELVNEAARGFRPFVSVVVGPFCVYHQPLARNPDYDGVDLSDARRVVGCAFCGESADHRFRPRTRPEDLVMKQLRAAFRTSPPERFSPEFILTGAAAFLRIGPLIERILADGLPASDLYFYCRIDWLRRKSETIDRLLPRVAEAGHTINIFSMGLENFSPAENRRFNKGVSVEDIDEAYRRIIGWEEAFPDAFRFHAHGGFGAILFTPWTTVEDLRLNLAGATRVGISPHSLFWYSRLQLLGDRPVTALARRDGLLTDRFEDPALVHIEVHSLTEADQRELPWRFAHPEVAAVAGLVFRLRYMDREGPIEDDDALVALRAVWSRLGDSARSIQRVFAAALDATEAEPGLTDVDRLIALLAERLQADTIREEPRSAADIAEEQREALRTRVRALFTWLEQHPRRPLAGFRAEESNVTGDSQADREVSVRLVRDDGAKLDLFLKPRRVAPHAFVTAGVVAVMHADGTPVDTPEKRAVARRIAHTFDRHLPAPFSEAGDE